MTQLIVFEGLSPWLIGTPAYVQRGLLEPLATHTARIGDKNAIHIWRGSFMSAGPNLHVEIPEPKRIVIGHSMGGASAIDWCHRHSSTIDLLLTLDPRPFYRPYIKPANVKRAVNIYQRGWWMPGYRVEGAENFCVTTSHTAIPFSLLAQEKLREAL